MDVNRRIKFGYVLPDPTSYRDWSEFECDLACMRDIGYDAVELQIADPAELDEVRIRKAVQAVGFSVCAIQTGSTYYSRSNCLCTPNEAVRSRTIDLLESFVDLASRWKAVIVFGSLQGRLKDEPDRSTGETRIRESMRQVGEYALEKGATIAFEPVNHGEVGFHNTIGSVAILVRHLNFPSVGMMVDTFHMNIEEKDMLAPLADIADILMHVHLSETNRDVLGEGHWDITAFLDKLDRLGYNGFCSIGVYNTGRQRRDCMAHCMRVLNASWRP